MTKYIIFKRLIVLAGVLAFLFSCQKENRSAGGESQVGVTPSGPFEQWDTLRIVGDTMPTAFPTDCSVWMGHLVIAADSLNECEANITLLSRRDWDRMTSANHADFPTMARDSAQLYREAEAGSWHIPSEEEARWLRSNYGEGSERFSEVNRLLLTMYADTIALFQGSQNARYLCAEGQKTFSFRSNTNVTAGGATIKNYHLRLISNIHLTR